MKTRQFLFLALLMLLPSMALAQCPDNHHPHMIDLGLPSGTKWACCNVGADTPVSSGDYYSWGETDTKTSYTYDTYTYYEPSEYCCINLGDISGTKYDVATKKWGENWQMPTIGQYSELAQNCTFIWTTENGVNGAKFTGKNGKSIFIPTAGQYYGTNLRSAQTLGIYWLGTEYDELADRAFCMVLTSSTYFWDEDDMFTLYGYEDDPSLYFLRVYGYPVRPVSRTEAPPVQLPLELATNSLTLTAGDEETVEITSGNGSYSVASSNNAVATATIDGSTVVVNAVDAGNATITVTDTESGETATIQVGVKSKEPTFVGCPDDHHPHMIDLGLPSGTKWACCNVGTDKPEGYGYFYAWGETKDNYGFDWSIYTHCDGAEGTCHDIGEDIAGTEFDVAHEKWEGNWLMPSESQYNELLANCTHNWTMVDTPSGYNSYVRGIRFIAPNGNSIFFPAAGFDRGMAGDMCFYWTSTSSSINTDYAKCFYVGFETGVIEEERYRGYSVRPVYDANHIFPITLSLNDIEINAGKSTSVNIISGNGSYTVSSSDEAVATAVIDGSSVVVTAVGAGTATITVTDSHSGQTATIQVTVNEGQTAILSCPDDNHPHMIDLGLPSGTKWACCNVDTKHPESQSPTNIGGYYAWGETDVKDGYFVSNYTHCEGTTIDEAVFYDIGSNISGTKYDVAHKEWGDDWRMPTLMQREELLSNTTYTWTNVDGISGGMFTGANGNSIFLPAAGFWDGSMTLLDGSQGFYWTGMTESGNVSNAYFLGFKDNSTFVDNEWVYRIDGMSVRPVGGENSYEPLTLASTTLSLTADSEETINITSGNGSYTVTSSDEAVATAVIEGNSVVVTAVGAGTATITVTDSHSGQTVTIEVTVNEGQTVILSCPDDNHPHMIDLGLPSGTKWACCNVGADKPDDYGGYYAWGETSEKDYYDYENYEHYNWSSPGAIDEPLFMPSGKKSARKNVGADKSESKSSNHTKGKNGPLRMEAFTNVPDDWVDLGSNISGTEFDAATANWGNSWQMPSEDEFQELFNKCSYEPTTINGHAGLICTGPNGNNIFLPFAGWIEYTYSNWKNETGCYWTGDNYYAEEWQLDWDEETNEYFHMWGDFSSYYYLNEDGGGWDICMPRYGGLSVRPVALTGEDTPSDNIEFADATVKSICVSNWDTNGDGELSYEEAAAVTDLNYAFAMNGDITSFDELHYFTGLTIIGTYSFAFCEHLTSIHIPLSVETFEYAAFAGCRNLPSITVDEEHAFFRSEDCVLFNKDMSTLIWYPICKPETSYSIPNTVQCIGNNAFFASNLTSITIPSSVTRIEREAFCSSKSLSSITIPSSVSYIGFGAFEYCSSLTSITLPNSTITFDGCIFNGCTNLSYVISFIAEPLEIEESNFYYDTSTSKHLFTPATLYVPIGTVESYRNTAGWSNFANIEEMLSCESFTASLAEPEQWNNLRHTHQIAIEGRYASPVDLHFDIDYAVGNSDIWTPLTHEEQPPSDEPAPLAVGTPSRILNYGEDFWGDISVKFSHNGYDLRFRARDDMGNTTLFYTMEIADVSDLTLEGITDQVYTGSPIYQNALTCDLEDGQWATTNYEDNVNVGEAYFNLVGVFPYSIGSETYSFNITPRPLTGRLNILTEDLVFNADYQYPEWEFSLEAFRVMKEGKDYNLEWSNNFMPGTGTLTVEAFGNYKGSLTTTFTIRKAPLREDLYSYSLPAAEIEYDGESYGADVHVEEYVGEPTVTYVSQDGTYNSTVKPSEGGEYDIYLEIAEGTGYLGLEKTKIGQFIIYAIPEEEWALLQAINNDLGQEASAPWDLSPGRKVVTKLPNLTVFHGHVTSIDLSGKGFSGDIPVELFALPNLETLRISGNSLSGDVAALLATYANAGGDMAGQLKLMDISGNQLTGNLGLLASHFPELETLQAHDNHFSEVSPMISPRVTNLSFGGQTIPTPLTLSVADLASPSLPDQLPTILTYNHQAQTYDHDANMLLTTAVPSAWSADQWSLLCTWANGNTSLSPYKTPSEYYGESGAVVYLAKGRWSPTVNADSWVPVNLTFSTGDANFNGDVNVLDLQTVINYIFKDPWTLFNHTAANVWKDQTINVQDVIGMVNVLMENGMPTYANSHRHVKEHGLDAMASVVCENGMLMVHTAIPVSAFEIFVSGCSDVSISQALQAMGMVCEARPVDDGWHVVGYSLSGATLPMGETLIGTLSGHEPVIVSALLSDKNANEIPSVLNESITDIDLANAGLVIMANTQGIVLHTPQALGHLSWSIYELSGSLMDQGEMSHVPAGSHLLYHRDNLRGKPLIVKAKADDGKEIIKKIMIK